MTGTQFHTEGKVGTKKVMIKLDSGRPDNAIGEELVVNIFNYHRQLGLTMSCSAHPSKALETWEDYYGGHRMDTGWSVLLVLQLTQLGHDYGPLVLVRFRVCETGSTHGCLILGARALDHATLGGLGHSPECYGHRMKALNINMKRVEPPTCERNWSSRFAQPWAPVIMFESSIPPPHVQDTLNLGPSVSPAARITKDE